MNMSLEAWSTAASIGTFLVIATTAIAALIQLRHLRSNNQIAAVTDLQHTFQSESFVHKRNDLVTSVPKLIADPAGRARLAAKIFPEELGGMRDVGNFVEVLGAFVKLRIVDRRIICDPWDGIIFTTWKELEPVIMIRREVSWPGTWTNFEYLAVICEESVIKQPGGKYPRGMRRMKIDERSSAAAALLKDRAKEALEPST